MSDRAPPYVRLERISKSFGPVSAIDRLDLDISPGEFTVLVGPSGCGKSTLLRVIAGLEEPDDGRVLIGGRDVTDERPKDRDIAMVFQNYALYPYMSVFDNISFGLTVRREPRAVIEEKVGRAARMLAIERLLQRRPRELSGGQRQRVAMGRALVREPSLFLFDEPLSNLDAQLREEMRHEIRRLHRDIGATMIYVTHDQIEAMTLADRIVLMRDGRIEQVAAPRELYRRPRTLFAARFIGSPAVNLIEGETAGDRFQAADGVALRLPPGLAPADGARPVVLAIRPEHVRPWSEMAARGGLVERITAVALLAQPTGPRTIVDLEFAGTVIQAEFGPEISFASGDRVEAGLDMSAVNLFDPDTGEMLASLFQ